MRLDENTKESKRDGERSKYRRENQCLVVGEMKWK